MKYFLASLKFELVEWTNLLLKNKYFFFLKDFMKLQKIKNLIIIITIYMVVFTDFCNNSFFQSRSIYHRNYNIYQLHVLWLRTCFQVEMSFCGMGEALKRFSLGRHGWLVEILSCGMGQGLFAYSVHAFGY
jgi:hypothetical protein